jgi:hypothetical protein
MATLPAVLLDFANLCQSHYGTEAAGSNDSGVYVALGDRVVQVKLDPNAGRVVFWTELTRPDHSEIHDLEEAALLFSSHELLDHGFVLGFNAATDLILVGRSIEQDVLQQYAGLKILSTVAEAANRAQAALDSTSLGTNGRSPEDHPTMVRM